MKKIDMASQIYKFLSEQILFINEEPLNYISRFSKRDSKTKKEKDKVYLVGVSSINDEMHASYEILSGVFLNLRRNDKNEWKFISVFSKDGFLSSNIAILTYILNFAYGKDTFGKAYIIRHDSFSETRQSTLSEKEIQFIFTDLIAEKEGCDDTYIIYDSDLINPSLIITTDFGVFLKCQKTTTKIIIN